MVGIAGGHNLRDMGGHVARDGRRLKYNTLYRSGVMAQLSEADIQAFRQLGIVAICDFRTPHERKGKPTLWHEGEAIEYYARDYDLSSAGLEQLLRAEASEPGEVERVIHRVYRKLPDEQAEAYRTLFAMLLAGKVPLLFNCTAGKDRTGMAAALVMTALDMPPEAIEADYVETERVIEALEQILLTDPRYARLSQLGRAEYLPLFQAKPEYLATAFDEIEQRHGGVEAYFEQVLGVGKAERERLKELLLE
jgi:protein-tyrosine phosphatase